MVICPSDPALAEFRPSPATRKIFALSEIEIVFIVAPFRPTEGAIAIVHEARRRNAMDVRMLSASLRAWTKALLTSVCNVSKSRRGVPIPRRLDKALAMAMSAFRSLVIRETGLTSPGYPRRRYKP